MLKITEDKIYLTRGDTADIIVKIYDQDKEEYHLQEGDVLVFTMKSNCETTDAIITRDCSTDSIIHLFPDDTNGLAYGTYYFDVQLTTAFEQVYTVIPPHEIIISKEVTFNAVS